MARRLSDAKSKARIVFEGLRGRSVSELCMAHQIGQGQYYQWRDEVLSNAAKAFEVTKQTQRECCRTPG